MNSAPGTNGTFLSLDGRLLTADEDTQQIRSHRIGASGPEDTRVLAGPAEGIDKKPNDLCQLKNGNIYFTGPDWGTGPADQGVYLLRPDGTVTRVVSGLYQPNGIIASKNGSKLYVGESSSSDNSKKRWWVFPIQADGSVGSGSVFFQPVSPPSYNDPDGMTIDQWGNLYFCGMGGVWIVSPQGEQLEFISVPEFCSNVTFGGSDGKTLYITCQDKVYSLQMRVRGGTWAGYLPSSDALIPKTTTPPTIDGTADTMWSAAYAYSMDNVLLGSVSGDADLSGTWQGLWDEDNLYFLVRITDDAQYNDSPNSTPWEDDAVELYIDANHSLGSTYDGIDDFELIFRWNDPCVVHVGVLSVTDTTGMVFEIVPVSGGYIYEGALPWSTLGVTPTGNNYIGLDVHVCDDDNGGNREAKKAWWTLTDDSWQYPYLFASALLIGEGTAPPPPPPPPEGIVFDAVGSAGSTDFGSTLSWSHTIGSGDDRLLVVGVQAECEDGNEARLPVQSIKYNDVDLTKADSAIIDTGYALSSELWYLLDAGLPAAGTYTIQVTYSGVIRARTGGSVSVSGATQAAPEDTATATATANPISATVTASEGAWVFDSVGCGNDAGTFTPQTAGMTKRYERQGSPGEPLWGCVGAGSTIEASSPGTISPQWSCSSVNRMAQVAASFAPAP